LVTSGDQTTPIDGKLAEAFERMGHVMRVQLRAVASHDGLSPMQADLLLQLSHRGPAEVGQLAASLDVRKPTISDSVAALERKGLLVRHSIPADRRRHRLELTPSGRAAAARLAEWRQPFQVALAETHLPADSTSKAAIYEWLVAVVSRLHEDGLVTVARTCGTCRFFRPDSHNESEYPHHCALLDLPLGGQRLRLDCPEHEPAA
jgi:DNA-binding MarR family transcriptional regulator